MIRYFIERGIDFNNNAFSAFLCTEMQTLLSDGMMSNSAKEKNDNSLKPLFELVLHGVQRSSLSYPDPSVADIQLGQHHIENALICAMTVQWMQLMSPLEFAVSRKAARRQEQELSRLNQVAGGVLCAEIEVLFLRAV